jgi:hypothetical protein
MRQDRRPNATHVSRLVGAIRDQAVAGRTSCRRRDIHQMSRCRPGAQLVPYEQGGHLLSLQIDDAREKVTAFVAQRTEDRSLPRPPGWPSDRSASLTALARR